jgi:hypothetical protein
VGESTDQDATQARQLRLSPLTRHRGRHGLASESHAGNLGANSDPSTATPITSLRFGQALGSPLDRRWFRLKLWDSIGLADSHSAALARVAGRKPQAWSKWPGTITRGVVTSPLRSIFSVDSSRGGSPDRWQGPINAIRPFSRLSAPSAHDPTDTGRASSFVDWC